MKKIIVFAGLILFLVFFMCFGAGLVMPSVSFADNITLVWNPNSETDLAGYRLYQSRASGTYDKSLVRADIQAGTEIIVLKIDGEGSYFWVLTAYDTNNNESGFSNEVNINFDSIAPNAPINFGEEQKDLAKLSRMDWTIESVSSVYRLKQLWAANIFDGKPETRWQSDRETNPDTPHPHQMVIDMGKEYAISGFYYLARQDEHWHGTIKGYEFRVSLDGDNWTRVAFGNLEKIKTEQFVPFSSTQARYIEFTALSEVDGNVWASIAELNVLGK